MWFKIIICCRNSKVRIYYSNINFNRFYLVKTNENVYKIHYVSTMIRFYEESFFRDYSVGIKLANNTGVNPNNIKTNYSYKSENEKIKLYEYYSQYYSNKYVICKADLQCSTCEDQTGEDCVYRKYNQVKTVNSSFNLIIINVYLLIIALFLFI